jgi:hypothetical protein
MWSVVHQCHQFLRFVDDGSTIAPGKYGSKETGYLNVLFFLKCMRNGNGITANKKRPVVFVNFFVENDFYV